MKHLWKWLTRIGIALLILVVALAGTGTWFVRRSWPEVSGSLKVAGLTAPVEVIRDRWGVPNIYAQNEHDLLFAQGYVHAQDRLWQMEMNRRLASGTLSEVLGQPGVTTDTFMRTIGLRRIAELSWPQLDQDSRSFLEAYAAGVNAYIDTHRDRLPLEYTILSTSPQPWTPVDSLVWGNLMAIYGSHNMMIELLRGQILAKSGPEAASNFFPPYAKGTPFIISQADNPQGKIDLRRAIPPGIEYDARSSTPNQQPTGLLAEMSAPPASNSWVVSGKQTATGMPILANDPHMSFLVNFYENGLHGGRFDVTGYTFPGVPLTIIGHNQKIAWGITIFNPDVQDGFLEKLDNNENPTQYEFNGEWRKVDVLKETINVKGGVPIDVNVYSTHHGPIINLNKNLWMGYLNLIVPGDQPLAFRWSLQEGSVTFRAIKDMNLATNWDEFHSALQYWDTVGQNFVYADVDGNIGFQLAAKLPVRASKEYGLLPLPGWSGENEWQGYVPYEQLPWALNPASNMIVTANNKVISDDYPLFLSYEDEPGYRAQRITDLLSQKNPIAVDDMAAIHGDSYSLVAEILRPYLVALQPTNDLQAQAIERLKSWDLRYTSDSVAASIFEMWYVSLLKNTDGKRYGKEFLYSIEYLELVKHGSMVVETMADPTNAWFDDEETPQQETRDDVSRQSLADALTWLSQKYGSDPNGWQWGKMHTATFTHFPLSSSGIKPIEWLANSAPIPVSGSMFSVNAYSYEFFDPFAINYGVKLRMIADTSNWDNTLSMLAPGESGHLFNPNRQDQIALWKNTEYHVMPFSREAVEKNAETRLTLAP